MIADILFEWNVLTATLAAWIGTVLLTVAVDVGPEIYRENKARHMMATVTMEKIAARRAARPTLNPDETMQLGVFKIQPHPVRRRHARV